MGFFAPEVRYGMNDGWSEWSVHDTKAAAEEECNRMTSDYGHDYEFRVRHVDESSWIVEAKSKRKGKASA